MLLALTTFSILLILLLLLLLIYKPPAILITHLQRRTPSVLWQTTPTNPKFVALTIDDGPSKHTAAILNELERFNAKATHFVIGEHTVQHPTVLGKILAAGHELGNHGQRDEPASRLSLPALEDQILSTQREVEAAYKAHNTNTSTHNTGTGTNTSTLGTGTGSAAQDGNSSAHGIDSAALNTGTSIHGADAASHGVGSTVPSSASAAPRLYRPGHGVFNKRMLARIEQLGFKLVMGGIYPHDPQIRLARLNAWHIYSGLKAGAVIICHDRAWTPDMLRILLPKMQREGWSVVTVSQLLQS